MESTESLEEESLLGTVGESESLDGLGSVLGSSSDSLGGERKSSVGVLDDSVSLVVRLVSNSELVLSSERLSAL